MSEEIKEEIEALLSIYEDDMEVLKETPNYVISMNVRSMNEIEGCPTVTLKITYPDEYPEELAEIEFDEEDYENFEDDDLTDLKKTLHETVSVYSIFVTGGLHWNTIGFIKAYMYHLDIFAWYQMVPLDLIIACYRPTQTKPCFKCFQAVFSMGINLV